MLDSCRIPPTSLVAHFNDNIEPDIYRYQEEKFPKTSNRKLRQFICIPTDLKSHINRPHDSEI